jgi:hypothetical protein
MKMPETRYLEHAPSLSFFFSHAEVIPTKLTK